MPVNHSLWTISNSPQEVKLGTMPSEATLEKMITVQPRILSSEWMLIGQQIPTGLGGRIDLLAIAPDGSLVLVELKRDRTPREVVAQALDYAAWVQELTAEKVTEIYSSFRQGGSLRSDFRENFGLELDEDEINRSHQVVIVAAELDSSSERIVNYLNERGLAINVLFFQVFDHGDTQLLSRVWLIDPAEVQEHAASSASRGEKEPWNGEFYVSFGDALSRDWEEARKYNFICGGGGTWYSNSLKMLSEGDRIWVKIPGKGFVGVGRVTGDRVAAKDFTIDDRPAMEVLAAAYHRHDADDPEKSEYFVPVEWEKTIDAAQGIQEPGMFGNQNTVCKPVTPRWRTTVNRLKEVFEI